MIEFFDTYYANRLEGINKELKELEGNGSAGVPGLPVPRKGLDIINIETHSQYTRVWYRKNG